MKPAAAWFVALAFACLALSGCSSSGSEPAVIDPNQDSDYVSGRTIHLKMSVVDYDQEVYPGLNTWLWAFCVDPFDATDTVSAAAIQYLDRLPSDGTNQQGTVRDHCGVPGPTIRVQQGDHVVVEFTNSHVHPHTIHWHGQYVPNDADGAQGVTQDAVAKSGAFTYDFIAKRAGTLWYHCHVDAGFHQMQGLYGMFIVEPHSQAHEPSGVDHEETLVLSTVRRATVEAVPGTTRHNHPPGSCSISGTAGCQNPPQDLTPDVFLINGHSYPLTEAQAQSVLHIAEGQTIRVRILNAGMVAVPFHLHGQDMEVIAEDGVPLATPYYADTVNIIPAARVDVLIHGNNPGVWLLHSHQAEQETNDMQFPGGMHTMLVYKGHEDQMNAFHAELPGGMPYMADVFPPQDAKFSDTVYVNNAVAPPTPLPSGAPPQAGGVSEVRSFNIAMACATKGIDFVARFDGNAAAASGSNIHISIRDSHIDKTHLGGYSHFEGNLGKDPTSPGNPSYLQAYSERQRQLNATTFSMPTGNWTITLSGTAVESVVTLQTDVDYYNSWEEQLESHHTKLTPLCGKYGYGNDGRVVGAPSP